jgi:hypothetical protein
LLGREQIARVATLFYCLLRSLLIEGRNQAMVKETILCILELAVTLAYAITVDVIVVED